MKCSKIALVIAAIAMPAFALANACTSIQCTATIKQIVVGNGDNIQVQLQITQADEDLLNCTLASDTYFTLVSGDTRFDQIYSGLLSAQVRRAQVEFRILEGSNNCEILYVRLM